MAGLEVVLIKVVLQLKKFVISCFYGYLVISDMYGNNVGKVYSIKKVTYQFPKACRLFKPHVYSSRYRIASVIRGLLICPHQGRACWFTVVEMGDVFSNFFFHAVCSLPVWCSMASSLRLYLMFSLASFEVPAQNSSADLTVENSSLSKNQSHLL